MRVQICHGDETTDVELPESSAVTIGGADADTVRIDSVEPTLLRISREDGRAVVELTSPRRIGPALCPAQVRRLLVPGEEIELPLGLRARLAVDPAPPKKTEGTLALMSGLFGGDGAVELGAGGGQLATLTCLTGLDLGKVLVLVDGPQDLGRGEVPMRIRDRSVSRRHARVEVRGGMALLTDLGSPNGVFVNGARIAGAVELSAGDILELGHSLLRYSGPPKPPPAEPPPADSTDAPEQPPEGDPNPRRRAEPGAKAVALALLGRLRWHTAVVGGGVALAVASVVACYAVLSGPSRADGRQPGPLHEQLHQPAVVGEKAGEVQRHPAPADGVHGDRPGQDVHLADVGERQPAGAHHPPIREPLRVDEDRRPRVVGHR